jgi:hypothetical protein
MPTASRFLPLILVAIAGLCLGPGGPPQAPAPKPPPLELDADAPLLLEARKPAERADAGKKSSADNAACLVCHANFKREALANTHAVHGIPCTKCHGPSVAHRNDEANVIPPDVMFATACIDSSCARCHDSHDVAPKAVIARFLERTSGKASPRPLACTSCHGEHQLSVRTVRWDRATGKVLAGAKK